MTTASPRVDRADFASTDEMKEKGDVSREWLSERRQNQFLESPKSDRIFVVFDVADPVSYSCNPEHSR